MVLSSIEQSLTARSVTLIVRLIFINYFVQCQAFDWLLFVMLLREVLDYYFHNTKVELRVKNWRSMNVEALSASEQFVVQCHVDGSKLTHIS